MKKHNINVIDFPYFDSKGDSAVGCYLNFLETEQIIFLSVFDVDMDKDAIITAKNIINKKIVPININEIAKYGDFEWFVSDDPYVGPPYKDGKPVYLDFGTN